MRTKIVYAIAIIGILLAIFGFVRSGGIIFSIGASGLSFIRYQSAEKRRKIELIIPIAIAVALFVVALTLPHGK